MITLRKLLPIIGLFACTTIINAQVGIGTTNPEATLHVVGTLKVETTNTATPTKLTGVDANGVMGDVTLGTNLTFSAGTLSVSDGGDDHSKETMAIISEDFNTLNNWDIGLGGANSDVTVFIVRKNSGAGELKIRGISGGTDGRRIRIINDSGNDIRFEKDTGGTAGNKIYIFTQDNKMTNYGSCLLIYSTNISSDGHWCLVQLDDI